jgi:enamine deaminase RidA (YjgF/YER057c/UK114 family)
MNNNIERLLIYPTSDASFAEQLIDCLSQIAKQCESKRASILQQSFFVSPDTNSEYNNLRQKIISTLGKIQAHKPSTSIIAQTPAYGHLVTVELILSVAQSGQKVVYKTYEKIPYTLVESDYCKEIYAAGISSYKTEHVFLEQTDHAFRMLKGILQSEGMTFADIVRQWNYVENILSVQDKNGHFTQHYQILNDVRSIYYAEVNFENGFPAATGIGMNAGGIILEIYAVSVINSVEIHPLKNPLQVDAYNYSDDVLVGAAAAGQQNKTTPKFERAKFIGINSEAHIYISGTASIHNELTVGIDDPVKQTETTLENIAGLISPENLQLAGINQINENPFYLFIRVYIKHQAYLDNVRKICARQLPDIPVHYLIADVCRENLLVEIEGVAKIV